MPSKVANILRRKGAEVVTVPPTMSVGDVAVVMADRGIGALPVSADGSALDGIVSERDLVRAIARMGAAGLDVPVSDVMTAEVTTCDPDTSVDTLMVTMTNGRFRHLPVLVDGALAGIVSIGDVVQIRVEELELQAQVMEQYVTGSA